MIKVIGTGGTIANTAGGRLAVADVLEQVDLTSDVPGVRIEDASRVASSALGFRDFADIADRVNSSFMNEPDVEGIVVTVGSNQAEDLAYFLHLTVRSDQPVVVTAAQRKRGAPSEDATRNFVDALTVAASPEARGAGVTLTANELIHPAREVTKNVVSRTDTWQSLDTGALGIVSEDRAFFYRLPVRRHTTRSEFTVDRSSHLPRAEILYSYADADPFLIEAAVDRGARGLVIAGFVTGAVHAGQQEVLEHVLRDRVAVVVAHRGSSGRISSARTAPFIGADNLSPQKALILLRLALAASIEADDLQRVFDEY
jgi:L-asparaginase